MNDRDRNAIRDALGRTTRDQFADGFADRAAARWNAARASDQPLGAIMGRQFRRLAPLATAAALLVAANNLRHRDRSGGQSSIQAVFGIMPARTIAITPRIKSLDELYGLSTLGNTE